jgi:hypothetical protein
LRWTVLVVKASLLGKTPASRCLDEVKACPLTSQRPKIRLHVCDFWPDFVVETSYPLQALSKYYDVVFDHEDPEILLYSCFGAEHLEYDCVKLFLTGENLVPDFNYCDYAIGFHHLSFEDRYLRFLLFSADQFLKEATQARTDAVSDDLSSRRFCNFIYSNNAADPVRDAFFHVLNERKKVDSFGRHLKNTDVVIAQRHGEDWSESKRVAQRAYNFTIAFENSQTPGYVTEKLLHAFIAGTIPIYWGDPRIAEDFNPKAFIHLRDFDTPEDCADYVVALSEDPERMAAYLSEPVFVGNVVPSHLGDERLESFLRHICDQPAHERLRRPPHGGFANYLIERRKREQRVLNAHARYKRALKRVSLQRIFRFYANRLRR